MPDRPSTKQTESKDRPLGLLELIAIALGGMIGGGIFSILGISVEMVGDGAPIAIFLGGLLASCAAYSYVKLATYYEDEGATYSFFKKTFPNRKFAIATIGWFIVFGYISTLALYAYTFASYFSSLLPYQWPWLPKVAALTIIIAFATINLISVNGMGKIEDLMVYIKVAILLVISGLFLRNGQSHSPFTNFSSAFSYTDIVTVAALTFVAYEGFQLVIHAYEEAKSPQKNVPAAIYWAITSTTFIYVILALGALMTIPSEILIRDKEFALAAGASNILGPIGYGIVITGALLATSSAINGTLFGASRLMAVIASDGVFPKFLGSRVKGHIPKNAIIAMSLISFLFILSGGLQSIIEFGSITFIIVSFLMAYSNFTIRHKTNSHSIVSLMAMFFLGSAAFIILFYKATTDIYQLLTILGIYILLAIFAKLYSLKFI